MEPHTHKADTSVDHATAIENLPHIKLSDSALREELNTLTTRAGELAHAGNADESAAVYQEVAEKAGMEILESRNPCEDLNYVCADYTLVSRLNAEWYPPENILELYDNPIEFLESNGFEPVSDPRNGDLAVYLTLQSDRTPVEMHHIGLVMDGRVESKLNYGPIIGHDFENVPSGFGEVLMFFRSENTDLNLEVAPEL